MILLHTSRESHFLTPSTMKGSENGFTAAPLPLRSACFRKKKNAPFKSRDSKMNCPKKIRQCNYNKTVHIHTYIHMHACMHACMHTYIHTYITYIHTYIYIYILYTLYYIVCVCVYIICIYVTHS